MAKALQKPRKIKQKDFDDQFPVLVKPLPAPPATVTPGPLAKAPATFVWPTGPIKVLVPGSKTKTFGDDGMTWETLKRWESNDRAAAEEFGLDWRDLIVIRAIEARGQHFTTGKLTGTDKEAIFRNNDGTGVPSIGGYQVKPKFHQSKVPGANAYQPDGNARMAAAVMKAGLQTSGTWPNALKSTYFTANDPNGTTQQMYVDTWAKLRAALDAGIGVITPPKPTDPYAVMFGPNYPLVTYGFGDDADLNYYEYGVGHGMPGAGQEHPGDDMPVPYGTKVYAPLDFLVDCVGTKGTARWGQGCGFYTDTGDRGPEASAPLLGVGNVTLYSAATGIKLTLGHMRTCLFQPGQTIKAGQQIGTSGGQNGAHTHVEVSILRNGTYWMVNPKPALSTAMGLPVQDTRPLVRFVGASVSVPLDVPFRIVLIPAGQTNQRPGTRMVPDRFVQHETGNPNVGTNANMHLRYLQNGALDNNGNPQQLGYHFTVDDKEAIQMIPVNEIAWHGGDSNGHCNYNGVSCELCVDNWGAYKTKSRSNAEKLAAAVMLACNLTIIQQHAKCCKDVNAGSGCHYNCPDLIQRDGYWTMFETNVRAIMAGSNPSTDPVVSYATPLPPPEWTGDDVEVNGTLYRAIRRNYQTVKDGVIARQYANMSALPVRKPLPKGEVFEGVYLIPGDDGREWILTTFGSRIPKDECTPRVTVAA